MALMQLSRPCRMHAALRTVLCISLLGAVCGLLPGCSFLTSKPAPPHTLPAPMTTPEPVAPAPSAPVAPQEPALVSQARTAKDYRRDAAQHLYAHNEARIYRGKLPPLLYAVGVVQVDIDRLGRVRDIRWMRAPKHAPQVQAEIERAVHAAAPFPAPVHMGRVTYTETWLWHKSGRFQLDTLTEGQL